MGTTGYLEGEPVSYVVSELKGRLSPWCLNETENIQSRLSRNPVEEAVTAGRGLLSPAGPQTNCPTLLWKTHSYLCGPFKFDGFILPAA